MDIFLENFLHIFGALSSKKQRLLPCIILYASQDMMLSAACDVIFNTHNSIFGRCPALSNMIHLSPNIFVRLLLSKMTFKDRTLSKSMSPGIITQPKKLNITPNMIPLNNVSTIHWKMTMKYQGYTWLRTLIICWKFQCRSSMRSRILHNMFLMHCMWLFGRVYILRDACSFSELSNSYLPFVPYWYWNRIYAILMFCCSGGGGFRRLIS